MGDIPECPLLKRLSVFLFIRFFRNLKDNTWLLSLALFVSYWFPIRACLNSFSFNGTRMGRVCLCKFVVNCFKHLKQRAKEKKLVMCVCVCELVFFLKILLLGGMSSTIIMVRFVECRE